MRGIKSIWFVLLMLPATVGCSSSENDLAIFTLSISQREIEFATSIERKTVDGLELLYTKIHDILNPMSAQKGTRLYLALPALFHTVLKAGCIRK
ncbi:hypothetical protein [Paenibacillus aceti]|uniref:hypothetical protein n=1 Tax=Paenibacillus aceti TaxID=1820010 RepID=UPI000EA11667|nr:hypothetical protein [Paenibacillus aceti]